MPAAPDRRLVILAEGNFGFHHGKTAMGVIRYGHDKVVAVIDSTQAGRNVREWLGDSGRNDIPIVGTLNDALGILPRADALLIGIAPTGGKLPDDWRAVILAAIRSGLDVLGGLHTFLGDDHEFAEAAKASGVRLIDYRRPPERMETTVGRRHLPGKRVLLTVGTDCAIGKMSVALELRRAAQAAGRSAVFVATGQTGMMVEGWGVTVDRVASDFLQGTVEWLVEDGETRGDWLIVEGQGSLDHPAYSSVTLGLIHGATPHAMVMVHKAGITEHDFDHLAEARFPIAELRPFIAAHETVASLVAPSKVVAVALNTSLIDDDDEARRIIAATAAETGLPCDDPVRFGGDALWHDLEVAVDALPWLALEGSAHEPQTEAVAHGAGRADPGPDRPA
jgi:D-glutamate N-acetyltransferase